MCGIIGAVVLDKDMSKVKKLVKDIYEQQKQRGEDGFGYAILSAGSLRRMRAKEEKEIFSVFNKENLLVGDLIIFHHRYPTSTPNIEFFNHPFLNEDGDVALAHNGCIQKYWDVYKELVKKGHKFETYVQKQVKYHAGDKVLSNTNYILVNDSEMLLHTYEDEGFVGFAKLTGNKNTLLLDNKLSKMGIYSSGSMFKYNIEGMNSIFLSSEKPEKSSWTISKFKHVIANDEAIPDGSFMYLSPNGNVSNRFDEPKIDTGVQYYSEGYLKDTYTSDSYTDWY